MGVLHRGASHCGGGMRGIGFALVGAGVVRHTQCELHLARRNVATIDEAK